MPHGLPASRRRPRLSPITLITAAVIVIGYLWWTVAPSPPQWDPLTGEERDAGLGRVIDELPLRQQDFVGALRAVAGRTGVRITVDAGIIKGPAVSSERRATFYLRNITAGRAIELIIDYFSFHPQSVYWRLRDGVVHIAHSLALEAGDVPVTRVYDTTDLIASAAAAQRRLGAPESVMYPTHPYALVMSRSLSLESASAEQLRDAVLHTVDPGSWQAATNGPRHAVCVGRRLVVTHTPHAHRRIEAFLHMLRQSEGVSR